MKQFPGPAHVVMRPCKNCHVMPGCLTCIAPNWSLCQIMLHFHSLHTTDLRIWICAQCTLLITLRLVTGCAYMYTLAWIQMQTTRNRQECVCSGFAEKWSCALRFESKLHRNAASCSLIAVPNLCCFCWCRWSSDKMSLPYAALYVGLMYAITVQGSIFLTAVL